MLDQGHLEHFLSTLSTKKSFSENTLAAYNNDLRQFTEYITSGEAAGVPQRVPASWTEVSRDHVVSFLLHLKERGFATTTVARKQAALKSFFKYLVERGVLKASPAETLSSPHVDRSPPHTISTSEADRLIGEIDREIDRPGHGPEALRDRAMMHLLYDTGLRVGELVALNTSDVDLDGGTVTIAARGRSRKVPVGSRLSVLLMREYLERAHPLLARARNSGGAGLAKSGSRRDGDALFLNHRGQRLTRQGFWLILKRYAERAGLGAVSPHTLRHSFAAQKLSNGVDMRDLQQVLGHASISTTQVYARLGGGEPRKKRKA